MSDDRLPPEIFYSYSHRDEALRDHLGQHMSVLVREGLISSWHDRRIEPGHYWATEIDRHLDSSRIILLLLSADFIASDYCYGIEMTRAQECCSRALQIAERAFGSEHPTTKLYRQNLELLEEDGKGGG